MNEPTLGLGTPQKMPTLGLGLAGKFVYYGKKVVSEFMEGDPYEDWKKTVGEMKDSSPARRAIRFINYEPETLYTVSENDFVCGELVDVIRDELKDYIVSHLFLTFCDKTVSAYSALDEGDYMTFLSELKELQRIANEAINAFKKENCYAWLLVSGNPDERSYSTLLILFAP